MTTFLEVLGQVFLLAGAVVFILAAIGLISLGTQRGSSTARRSVPGTRSGPAPPTTSRRI